MTRVNRRGIVLSILVLLGAQSQLVKGAEAQPPSNLAPSAHGLAPDQTTRAPAGKTARARVIAIHRGEATFSLDGLKWRPLGLGTVLETGSMIRTDAKAIVDLSVRQNESVVRVTPGTTLLLAAPLPYAEIRSQDAPQTGARLTDRRILGNARRLAKGRRYEATTPDRVGQAIEAPSYNAARPARPGSSETP